VFDPETMHSTVEWRQATPADAVIWVSVTRRSADQMPLESEESQIIRYKEESSEQQAQLFLLWRDDEPVGCLRFYANGDTAELDGLGQLLAVKAMHTLQEAGYPTVILYVTLGIPAVNLYHRLGFVEAGPTYIEAERMLM